VINYRNAGWQKEVQKITGGRGVGTSRRQSNSNDPHSFFVFTDVIYDPVGLIRDSLKCIAWKGRAIVVGFVGGEIEKVGGIFSLKITAPASLMSCVSSH
jgi:NADPH:quinone reductase-like Zn-dependent oxidoreductase